jgi:hypothetical protein
VPENPIEPIAPADPIARGDPQTLADLMKLSDQPHAHWPPADLAAIMAHQLRASLVFDLSRCAGDQRERIRQAILEDGENLITFGDLLSHPKPPADLLRLAKDFAKSQYQHPDQPLPPHVATLLYYACIAAARLRLSTRITDLDDAQFVPGLQWAVKQTWIDAPLRELLNGCLRRIQGEEAR